MDHPVLSFVFFCNERKKNSKEAKEERSKRKIVFIISNLETKSLTPDSYRTLAPESYQHLRVRHQIDLEVH